mgnify:CR=1 FL=1
MENFDLSKLTANNSQISIRQQLKFVWILSVPGILAQISSVLMQYIDAAMVGYLGANASASIGLVAPATWVIGGLIHAIGVGFTVQVAHVVGDGKKEQAKNILCQGILICLLFSIVMAAFSWGIHKRLPVWLGASKEIQSDASFYFLIFGLSSPFFEMVYLMSGMLQCSGNMRLPGILNALMCLFDIAFNWIFIYGLKMGVRGAALGSAASAVVIAAIITWLTLYKSEYLNLRGFKGFFWDCTCISKGIKIAVPVGVQNAAFSGALVIVSGIIAPLGAVALAANSFATTAESICYMPGYGIQEAATTLIGQSYGAKRKDLIRSFSWITVLAGMGVMALLGIVMYFICPFMFSLITPEKSIQLLATKVLRIELIAEPLFGAAIVCNGALRGKGDTLIPSILNLFSLWVVRLGLSLWLVKPFGLTGIWIAMAAELCFRGIILLIRLDTSVSKG